MFDLRVLYLGLSPDQRSKFCSVAGTSDAYVSNHLIHARRMPRKALMERLLSACQEVDSTVTFEQLVAFFYSGQRALDLRPADPAAPTKPDEHLAGAG